MDLQPFIIGTSICRVLVICMLLCCIRDMSS